MNTNSLLKSLASDLGDNEPGHENQRWSEDDLLRYWNEAVCIISDLRKDLFSCATLIKLQPGSIQDITPCDRLGEVIGQVDKHGNMLTPVAEASADLRSRWVGKSCALTAPKSRAQDYRIQSYSTDINTNKNVVVTPPVPPGADVYLQVNCTRRPKEICAGEDFDELDCGHRAAATQWVLARAYASAPQGSVEGNLARMHAQMFFQLLNVKMRADLMYSLGIVPTDSKNLINTRT